MRLCGWVPPTFLTFLIDAIALPDLVRAEVHVALEWLIRGRGNVNEFLTLRVHVAALPRLVWTEVGVALLGVLGGMSGVYSDASTSTLTSLA